MQYKKLNFEHSKLLSSVLHDIYIITSDNEISYSTAPNGLIGISIVLEGKCNIRHKNKWIKSPLCSIYGLIESPDLIKISNNFKEVAFGFKPSFFQLLTREKMSDIVKEGNLDASFIFSKLCLEKLVEKINVANSHLGLINAIEEFVASQLFESENDSRVLTAMELIYNQKNMKVEEMSDYLNLSSTSLRKLFLEKIGRSPKAMSNIIRINRILKEHSPNSKIDLQDLSFENNFFDLAHFSNSFKKTIGLPANKYFKDDSLTFDFYNFGRWKGDIFATKNKT